MRYKISSANGKFCLVDGNRKMGCFDTKARAIAEIGAQVANSPALDELDVDWQAMDAVEDEKACCDGCAKGEMCDDEIMAYVNEMVSTYAPSPVKATTYG